MSGLLWWHSTRVTIFVAEFVRIQRLSTISELSRVRLLVFLLLKISLLALGGTVTIYGITAICAFLVANHDENCAGRQVSFGRQTALFSLRDGSVFHA